MKALMYFPILLILSNPTFVIAKECTEKDAQAADEYVDRLSSWQEINNMEIKFKHCDDGEISEGISDSTVKLLINNWSDLSSLNALSKKNPRLKSFVLRHINTTLDTADLEKLKSLSSKACPSKELAPLCELVYKASLEALK